MAMRARVAVEVSFAEVGARRTGKRWEGRVWTLSKKTIQPLRARSRWPTVRMVSGVRFSAMVVGAAAGAVCHARRDRSGLSFVRLRVSEARGPEADAEAGQSSVMRSVVVWWVMRISLSGARPLRSTGTAARVNGASSAVSTTDVRTAARSEIMARVLPAG